MTGTSNTGIRTMYMPILDQAFVMWGVFVLNLSNRTLPAATGAMALAFGLLYLYCRRVVATWGRGLEAERQIGDFIDHAVAQRGCAVAHDVK